MFQINGGILRKIAFLFPGQGAQYPGMAKDFFDNYPIAKQTFEQADDLLHRKLSDIIFNGPDKTLTETKNSQLGIYIASIAILRVIEQLFPTLVPSVCAGLSLGEYTALTASGRLSFEDGLNLVAHRGQYMNDACEAIPGTMAVILGLNGDVVEQIVKEVNLPQDLWAANFNCPGQVVISGTLKGIEAGSAAAKAKGAKRVIPLQVHGAFHSGLMKRAEEHLAPYIDAVPLKESECEIVMNVTGGLVHAQTKIRHNLIKQVTHPVRWEQGVRHMMNSGVELFLELGCGMTLTGFNKRIGVTVPCPNVETVKDLPGLEELLKMERL